METVTMNMTMHNPAHPGEVLNEGWLKPLGLTVTETAKQLGVTRKHLSQIINAKASITADMSKRLEAFTGSSAKFWLNMQASYDLWQLRNVSYDIKKVAT